MVVGIKDGAKLAGIVISSFCAVFVCTLFLNYQADITGIEKEIVSEQMFNFYKAQVSTGKMVSGLSGGCLCLTSAVMLLFFIKQYIDTHNKELGILKALGCSNLKIAGNFWVFGSSVFLGTAMGFAGAFLLMTFFYEVQNKDQLLPEFPVRFHPEIFLYLVVLPAAAFSLLAVFYAWRRLKMPVLNLLRDSMSDGGKRKKHKADQSSGGLFLEDLKRNTLRDKKVLAFFIVFASFCFSAMTQMSFSMDELASAMMGIMIMLIGLVLACTTLFLAITTVIGCNKKTIAMMRVFGYSQKECSQAILGCYRPMAYIGFALGTMYQYVLLRIAVDIVFRDMEGMPEYKFDFPVMLISLGVFAVIYELVMYVYSGRISKISVKEIMLE